MLGNYVTQRWKDNDISKHNFNPIMKWKNIPDVVLSVHTSNLQQLIPTQVYKRNKKKKGLDLMCTICHSTEETVPHLLCGYSAIAQTIYKARYDRILRPIYHLILSVHNMELMTPKRGINKQSRKQALTSTKLKLCRTRLYRERRRRRMEQRNQTWRSLL